MKVDAKQIADLRKAKFWSQEELSVTSGLNLRTIQRIENTGSASLQSKKALASAFDINVGDLDYNEPPTLMKFEYKMKKYEAKGGSFSQLKLDWETIENEFNQMGEEGWELISNTHTSMDGGKTAWMVATFKRPKD